MLQNDLTNIWIFLSFLIDNDDYVPHKRRKEERRKEKRVTHPKEHSAEEWRAELVIYTAELIV